MYVDLAMVNEIAKLIGSIGVIAGIIIAIYKFCERDKRQSKIIEAMQKEQTLICYGLRGALQGLIEQGCNGPCKDALNKLDKHLNNEAHHQGEHE